MIGVNASGASIYGIAGKKPQMNSAQLQSAQFDNANLSSVDFSSANLAGVNFDYATLTNAVFQNTMLVTNARGTRASFIGSNIQGTNFDGATLSNVVFNNAAFGVPDPKQSNEPAGVWLFSLGAAEQQMVTAELEAAAATKNKPLHQFTLSLASLNDLTHSGAVSSNIQNQFKSAGVPLTEDAVLVAMGNFIYWQLTDDSKNYVLFHSFDTDDYRPAIGAAKGTEYTPTAELTLPLSIELTLKNGQVSPECVAAFKAAGHPISASARITIKQFPGEWQIINGAPGFQVYSLWLNLSVYGPSIIVRPAIPTVIQTFSQHSIALGLSATVSNRTTTGWMLNNGADNPFNPVKNYITFNLIPNETTGELDVYGSMMRILRSSSPGDEQFVNIPAAITDLTQKQMESAGIVCPNGNFSSTNQTNKPPYEQWLRARSLPKPPSCIPDPTGSFYCPL